MELLSKIQPQKPEFKPRKSRQEQIAERLDGMPESQRNAYLRATQGKASPRGAIKVFCVSDCMGGDREEVTLCTDLACPFYLYRPFKTVRGEQFSSAESKEVI